MESVPATWSPPPGTRGSGIRRSLPVIDLGLLREGGCAGRVRLARELGRAAREVGFFYVRGHGVDPALVSRVYAQARAFFRLPAHEKASVHIAHSHNHRGYVPFTERGDYADEGGERHYEAFDSALEIEAGHPLARANPLMGPNVWPDLPGFRATVAEYYRTVAALGRSMFGLFETYLGLDPGYFDAFTRYPTSQLRLLHYVENDAPALEDQMNMGAHTDYECFTILHQTAPGLQTMTVHGEWVDAPPIPGTFVVNIGDMMEVWTNGLFRSNPHRVLNTGRERFSLPFFVAADFDARIEPVPTAVTASRPLRYRPVVAGEHLLSQLLRDFPYLRGRSDLLALLDPRARAGAGNPFERSKLGASSLLTRAA